MTNKYSSLKESEPPLPATKGEMPALFHDRLLSERHSGLIIDPRVPVRLYWLNEHYVAADWSLADGYSEPFADTTLSKYFLVEFPTTTFIGCGIAWQASRASMLLNTNHSLVQWLERVKAECMAGEQCLTIGQFEMLIKLLDDPLRFGFPYIKPFQQYLDAWLELPDLSPELYPPKVLLSADMFELPHW